MRLLFLDESGRIGQDGLFALGGVAVRADEWRALRASWLAPLEEHGWDPANEVKWHGIKTGYVPPALADAVVDGLSRAPFTAYVTLLDLERGADLPGGLLRLAGADVRHGADVRQRALPAWHLISLIR